MDYSREIRRLADDIPDDFPCMGTCVLCCNKHRWTWTEWAPIEHKLVALEMEAKCPYATKQGCSIYHQRPIICRLYGTCMDPIGKYGEVENISLACPLGIEPKTPLSKKEARKIFKRYMRIIEEEDYDAFNAGYCALPAGPFGHFIRPPAGVVFLND